MKFLLICILSIHLFAYERIITLSPSINELIFALDGGEKIVGNTDFCEFPEESKSIPKVGGYFSPNLEKILALSPDMIVMQQTSIPLENKLKKLGLKTTVLKLTNLQDIKKTIAILGEMLHKKEKATKILQNIEQALQNIKGIVSNQKILIVIGSYTSLKKQVYVVGQNMYLDDIITASGNTNALQTKIKGQPILNMENIIASNPDIVILLSPYSKKRNISKKQLIKPWLDLPINAAKTKAIFVEENEYAGIPSDRLVYFLEDFKRYLTDAKNK